MVKAGLHALTTSLRTPAQHAPRAGQTQACPPTRRRALHRRSQMLAVALTNCLARRPEKPTDSVPRKTGPTHLGNKDQTGQSQLCLQFGPAAHRPERLIHRSRIEATTHRLRDKHSTQNRRRLRRLPRSRRLAPSSSRSRPARTRPPTPSADRSIRPPLARRSPCHLAKVPCPFGPSQCLNLFTEIVGPPRIAGLAARHGRPRPLLEDRTSPGQRDALRQHRNRAIQAQWGHADGRPQGPFNDAEIFHVAEQVADRSL